MTEEEFLVLVERYLEGTLVPLDRRALTQAVLSNARLRALFTEQVRSGLELAGFLKPEDAEDAERRAEIILSVDSETRDIQVARTLEERLGVPLSRQPGRKSTRIVKRTTVRQRPPMPRSAYWKAGAAAAGFVASVVALLFASRGGLTPEDRPTATSRDERTPTGGRPLTEVERREKERSDRGPAAPEILRPTDAVRPPEDKLPVPARTEAEKRVAERRAAANAGLGPVRIARLHGQANVLGIVKKTPARSGQDLMSDQGVEVGGQGSRVSLKLSEGTRLELDSDTTLSRISGPRPAEVGGRRVEMSRGILVAEVSPEAPVSIGTPGAELKIEKGTVRVVLESGATRVEVRQGRADLTRAFDPRTVAVGPGEFAVAAAGEVPNPREFREIVVPVTACAVEAGTADAPAPAVPTPVQTYGVLLKWDLSAVPAGSRVLSAAVVLHATDKVVRAAEAFELRRPWADAQGPVFARGSARGTANVGLKVLGVLAPGRDGEHAVPLTVDGVALVQSWVDAPAGNNGIVMTDLLKPDQILVDAPEAKRASKRPRLQVTFVSP